MEVVPMVLSRAVVHGGEVGGLFWARGREIRSKTCSESVVAGVMDGWECDGFQVTYCQQSGCQGVRRVADVTLCLFNALRGQ